MIINQKELMVHPVKIPPEWSDPTHLDTGHLTDISDICEFGWYMWCYYWGPTSMFRSLINPIGTVLGPSDHSRAAMYHWEMN